MFYRSIRTCLPAFGQIFFRSERSFLGPAQVASWMRAKGADQVLMPNPYGNTHRLRIYLGLRSRGIRVIASDRGALPDSWFFDAGFNADSPSYRPDAWDVPLSSAQVDDVREYIAGVRRGAEALEEQGKRVALQSLRAQLGAEGSKVLFVPLQRPGDTVIRYFAGAVGSMEGFLTLVDRIARELPSDWRVVVKPHPLEPKTVALTQDLVVVAPPETHVHDLLEIADVVLLVNSGVGVLSLMFGKPTLHTGQAFYGHDGLATHVDSVASAVKAVRAAVPPDPQRVERFIHHLRSRVYSFGDFVTRLVPDGAPGAMRRETRTIAFRELRILGETLPVPKKRILVISPVVPHPSVRGSETRVDMVLRSLADSDAEVRVCVLNHDRNRGTSDAIAAALSGRYPGLSDIVVMPHPKIGTPVVRLGYFFVWFLDVLTGGRQRVANLSTAPLSFRRLTRRVEREFVPTHLFVNYAKLAPCLPRRFPGVSIVDTHDDQTQLLTEGKTHTGKRRDVIVALYQRSERRALRRFARIVAINALEVPAFREAAPRAEVLVVPAFTEPKALVEASEHWDALFVGSRSSFNVRGLRWFVADVLPRILSVRPSFSLRVVGSVCSDPWLRAHAPGAVDLDGVVDDLAAAYASARTVIAPIQAGAGMKIKVVEALGYGKPLIGTAAAVRGIEVIDGIHARIVDDASGFADALLGVLDDDGLRRRMAVAAKELHVQSHSRAAVVDALQLVFRG